MKIKARQLSNLMMVGGNEKKYRFIIDRGILKEWVGIGWLDIRETNEEDYQQYPEVDHEHITRDL